jgi:hypothetical protein
LLFFVRELHVEDHLVVGLLLEEPLGGFFVVDVYLHDVPPGVVGAGSVAE